MWIDRIEMDLVGASISLKCKPNYEQSHCHVAWNIACIWLMEKVLRNETTKCAQLSCELTFSV